MSTVLFWVILILITILTLRYSTYYEPGSENTSSLIIITMLQISEVTKAQRILVTCSDLIISSVYVIIYCNRFLDNATNISSFFMSPCFVSLFFVLTVNSRLTIMNNVFCFYKNIYFYQISQPNRNKTTTVLFWVMVSQLIILMIQY